MRAVKCLCWTPHFYSWGWIKDGIVVPTIWWLDPFMGGIFFCSNWSFLLCSCVSHQLWPWILSSYPVLLWQFFLSDSLQELNSHPSFEAFVISESLTLCRTHPEHGKTLHHLKTLTGNLKGAFLKRPSQFSITKRKTAFWYKSVSAWLASKRKHSWPLYSLSCMLSFPEKAFSLFPGFLAHKSQNLFFSLLPRRSIKGNRTCFAL